jgi:hypothetical protein
MSFDESRHWNERWLNGKDSIHWLGDWIDSAFQSLPFGTILKAGCYDNSSQLIYFEVLDSNKIVIRDEKGQWYTWKFVDHRKNGKAADPNYRGWDYCWESINEYDIIQDE